MKRWRFAIQVFVLLVVGSLAAPMWASDWAPLVARLRADRFDERTLANLYNHPENHFDPDPMVTKIKALLASRHRATASPERFPGRSPFLKGYLAPAVIGEARAYLREHRGYLQEIKRRYGVPEEIIVSIILIETRLGRDLGKRKAISVLSSMALVHDLSLIQPQLQGSIKRPEDWAYAASRCREKSAWAYNELKHLLRYAEASGRDPLSIPGSIYGAIGICQFMPSNLQRYGVDATGKGYVDPFSQKDAFPSVANYLREKGWSSRMGRRDKHRLLLTYNRDHRYANTVLAVADRLKGGEGMRKKKGAVASL